MVSTPSSETAPDDARAAAASIFIRCFPLLLADAVRRAHPVGFHQFQLVAEDGGTLAPGLSDDDARAIITSAWIDLSSEPVVLRLPPMHGRYFNVTLTDPAGEPFASLGTRTGDDGGVDVALVGPNWRGELPSGLRAKRVPSDSIWAVGRLYAHSTLDRSEAMAVAKRQCLATLEPKLDRPRGALATSPAPASSCVKQVAEITPIFFFHRLEAILERAPEAFRNAIRPELDRLGKELGGPSDPALWSPELTAALTDGFADGMAAISAAAAVPHTPETPWRPLAETPVDSGDGLARAARAFASLGAPPREDLLSLVCDRDASGRQLMGGHHYRIHFTKTGLPPVDAFWWLSARPAAAFDRRRGLGDRCDLVPSRDGSLDLVVQHLPPDPALISNWLPAPAGRLSLNIRLYGPRAAALSGAWRMPPIERLDTDSGASRIRRPRLPPAAPQNRWNEFRPSGQASRISP